MGPKYEFTGETKQWEDSTLHRIRRLSDNKLGGWIEKETNLSQEGNCWVADNAMVAENAKVYGNAIVWDNAKVYGYAKVYDNARMTWDAQVCGSAELYDDAWLGNNAQVYGNAIVCGNAKVYDDAKVYGKAYVYDRAWVYGDAKVCGNAKVYGGASVEGNAIVWDNAKVYGDAWVYDNAEVGDNAKVYGDASVEGNAIVCDNAKVYGDALVYGNAEVCGNAKLSKGCISSGKYSSTSTENDKNEEAKVIKDFVYKIDESSKLDIQINYDSVDAFFEDNSDDSYVEHECLTIVTVGTKVPLVKLEKTQFNDKNMFRFIVDITNDDGDVYLVKSIIDSKDKFDQLLQSTIDSLKNYPQFSKYVNDLENCI